MLQIDIRMLSYKLKLPMTLECKWSGHKSTYSISQFSCESLPKFALQWNVYLSWGIINKGCWFSKVFKRIRTLGGKGFYSESISGLWQKFGPAKDTFKVSTSFPLASKQPVASSLLANFTKPNWTKSIQPNQTDRNKT
jgi:hypothetical protein